MARLDKAHSDSNIIKDVITLFCKAQQTVSSSIIKITTHAAETATIIKACQSGKTFERTEQERLEAYLEMLLNEWQEQGATRNKSELSLIMDYSHKAIAMELIRYLEG